MDQDNGNQPMLVCREVCPTHLASRRLPTLCRRPEPKPASVQLGRHPWEQHVRSGRGECRGGGWVGGWVCREVLCLRSFASDAVECMAQLAAAHSPAEAGAAKSVRGALGLAEATGERVRYFVVRCGWSMRRTLCGTSGSCAKKTVPRPSKECTSAYERQIRRIFGVSLLQLHLSVSRMLS